MHRRGHKGSCKRRHGNRTTQRRAKRKGNDAEAASSNDGQGADNEVGGDEIASVEEGADDQVTGHDIAGVAFSDVQHW